MGNRSGISLFLAGDAIITRPWSHFRDDRFARLIDQIRTADVSVVNLEMLLHEYNGFPQPGIRAHLAAPPSIAQELAWAGIDMVAHANNHAYDYGEIGILENLDNVTRAGLTLAGSGRDLQRARAPAYFSTEKGVVALISATATHEPYAFASPARQDMHGRPGPNPLSLRDLKPTPSQRPSARIVRRLERLARTPGKAFYDAALSVMRRGKADHRWRPRRYLDARHLDGNLAAIREARANADLVIFSLHTHDAGWWLEDLAHEFIDAGVDIVFIQGPHEIRAIEIYAEKPVFYGMGNFVNHLDWIERRPAEFFESRGLAFDAMLEVGLATRAAQHKKSHKPFEGIAASIDFEGRQPQRIRILPLDLGFAERPEIRGFPRLADGEHAHAIIRTVAEKSNTYGIDVRFDRDAGAGLVPVGQIP